MQIIPNKSSLQIAQWCLAKSIIPLPVKGKQPIVSDWPNFRPAKETLSEYFNGQQQNIGALLGPASQHLVDIDLDWPECEKLADAFLPSSWRFGRRDDAGRFHLRHVMLRCPDIASADWKAPASIFTKPLSIVQVLAGGKHVVLPGSRHAETGQEIEWLEKPAADSLAEIEAADLLQRVNRLAGTALLVRLWPDLEGSRHEVALALAGACHHAGWEHANIESTAVALLTAAHDPEKRDRAKAVHTTLEAAAAGKPVTGFPKLAELLPSDVTMALRKWWQLADDSLQLTINGQPMTEVGAKGAGATSQAHWTQQEWPELLEFESVPPSTADYPVMALDTTMAATTHEVVRIQQVPVPLAAQSVLSVAAAAAQPCFDVHIDGRDIPVSLWLALIAAAGERKTSTDKLVRTRTEMRMKEAAVAYRVQRDAWQAQKHDREAGDPGPKPRQPSWISTRGTVEGLLKSLDMHSPHTLFTTADAGSWFGGHSMREGRGAATVSVLSDLWSGESLSTVLASAEESADLFGRRLSMSFMLQPTIAAELFYTELMRSQGFLSRCLPAYPPSRIGSRVYQPRGETPALSAYWSAIDRLLTRQLDMDLETGELRPQQLHPTSEAYALWVAAYNHIEAGMADGREYAGASEVANKMPEQALRLAGVIAAIEGRAEIDAPTMQNGIGLMDYYLAEWLSLAGKLQVHKAHAGEAQQLWEWLVTRRDQHGQASFKLREAYKNGPRLIRNQSVKAKDLVSELIRRGYVRMAGSEYDVRPADQC